jgi:hypothetical protein
MAFLHFLVASLYHAPNHYVRLGVKFIQLHSEVTRVLGSVDLGHLGFGRLLLNELERVGVGEEGGKFLLKMVGFARILVNVVLDGDLDRGMGTRYISFSCWTRSML